MVERKSAQQVAAREVLGVVECKSAQQAAAREVPGMVERKYKPTQQFTNMLIYQHMNIPT
jgi:hypothetical protein